jgi:VIT1/CCC1 family predicted Fe2+/Mn2+ transporter
MKLSSRLVGRAQAFAVVVGLTDGILTALTLAAGHLLSGERTSLGFSFRVALGSAVCGIFVFFTAEYARLRGELIHAEMQLNLPRRGRFATTQLGKQVRSEGVVSAILSSSANFLGAFFPLLMGTSGHLSPLGALVPSLAALGMLGAALAHTVHGNYAAWIGGLIVAGLALSLLGIWLHIA